MKTLGYLAGAIILGMLLHGCGLFGSSAQAGSFHAATSGSLTRHLEGRAVFDSDYRTGIMPHLGLVLTSDEGSVIFESREIAATPAPGAYPVASFAAPQGVTAFFTPCGKPDCGTARSYLSTGGTLTLANTTEDHLQGSFDFIATNGKDTLHVTGDFDATGENYDADLR